MTRTQKMQNSGLADCCVAGLVAIALPTCGIFWGPGKPMVPKDRIQFMALPEAPKYLEGYTNPYHFTNS